MIYMDLSRTKKVFANIDNLKSKHVAIFGLGGVGGYVAEALVRSGVGKITVVDGDVVEASNINRQIIALSDNIGQPKVDAISLRLKAINPDVIVHAHNMFLHCSLNFWMFSSLILSQMLSIQLPQKLNW